MSNKAKALRGQAAVLDYAADHKKFLSDKERSKMRAAAKERREAARKLEAQSTDSNNKR